GIDFAQNLGVVALEDPATLGLIIRIKNAEPLRVPVWPFPFCPYLILIIGLLHLRFIQVVRVEDERLVLSEKDAPEGRTRLPPAIRVYYVHDVYIARAHQVCNIVAQAKQLPLLIE